jgi:hypothetical protein
MAETNAATDEPKPDGSNGVYDTAIRFFVSVFVLLGFQIGEMLEVFGRFIWFMDSFV